MGDKLQIQILKPKGSRTFALKVTDQVSDPPAITVAREVNGLGGLTVSTIGPQSPLYGQMRGVVVKGFDPGGPAYAFGLRTDDVIQSINDLSINEASQIVEFAQYALPVERARITRADHPYIVEFSR